jgi:hypothetical protein
MDKYVRIGFYEGENRSFEFENHLGIQQAVHKNILSALLSFLGDSRIHSSKT